MPPPPPPPPPPPLSSSATPAKTQNRAMLLNEIHTGTRLKKTVTNDRSAPIVSTKTNNATSLERPTQSATGKVSAPGNIGALFANGIPRKPSEAKNSKFAARREDTVSSTNFTLNQQANPSVIKASTTTTSVTHFPVNSNIQNGVKLSNNSAENNNASSSSKVMPPPPPPTKSKPSLPAAPLAINNKHSVGNKPSLPPTPNSIHSESERPSEMAASNGTNRKTMTGLVKSVSLAQQTLISMKNTEIAKPSISLEQYTTRTELTEDYPSKTMQKRRPAAPPPPPPPGGAPSLAQRVQQSLNNGRAPLPPPPSSTTKPDFTGSAGVKYNNGINAQNGSDTINSPPPPPPRVSSYLESIEQRFHFLPMSELPPAPRFAGFQKLYESAAQQKTNATMS